MNASGGACQQSDNPKGEAAGAAPVGAKHEDCHGQDGLLGFKGDEPGQHGQQDGRAPGAVEGQQQKKDQLTHAAEVQPGLQQRIAGGVEARARQAGEFAVGFRVDEGVNHRHSAERAENGEQAQPDVSPPANLPRAAASQR